MSDLFDSVERFTFLYLYFYLCLNTFSHVIDNFAEEYDDIFKGSHSSHFFANRNGGREDDFIDHPVKAKFNDFNDYNKKTTESATTGKTRAQPTRPKRIQQTSTTTTTATSTLLATNAPKVIKKITLQSYYNASGYDLTQQKSTTSSNTTTAATSTIRPSYSAANRFSFNSNDYQTQEKIEPTTYNPTSSVYRIKSTTPKYTEFTRENTVSARGRSASTSTSASSYLPKETTQSQSKPTASARKAQKLERTQQKLAIANEFDDFSKIKLQPPQPFQPVQNTQPTQSTQSTQPSQRPTTVYQYQEPQYFRSRGTKGEKSQRQGNQEPTSFSGSQKQRGTTTTAAVSTTRSTVNPESRPRGFASRGSINYKATTQRETDYYAPTTSTTKKFSTLVPKTQQSLTPTTFKPTTYQKPLDTFLYQTQQTVRPSSKATKQPGNVINTLTPTTANPHYDPDEDDGQYHPELYEVDFPRNRFNLQRSSTIKAPTTATTTTTRSSNYNNDFQNPQKHLKTQQQTAFRKQQEEAEPTDLSDEDELFKTAHSLNFGAASINKLRADIFKAEKNSQQYNSQYSPQIETSSTRSTSISTAYTTTTPSTTYNYFAYSTTLPTTKLYTSSTTNAPPTTASTTTTTRRPTTYITTPYSAPVSTTKVTKAPKSSKSPAKKGKKGKGASKRPPHADEDTSYDYAYYDTDTLSESPQEYPDYEIPEFVKTRRN